MDLFLVRCSQGVLRSPGSLRAGQVFLWDLRPGSVKAEPEPREHEALPHSWGFTVPSVSKSAASSLRPPFRAGPPGRRGPAEDASVRLLQKRRRSVSWRSRRRHMHDFPDDLANPPLPCEASWYNPRIRNLAVRLRQSDQFLHRSDGGKQKRSGGEKRNHLRVNLGERRLLALWWSRQPVDPPRPELQFHLRDRGSPVLQVKLQLHLKKTKTKRGDKKLSQQETYLFLFF